MKPSIKVVKVDDAYNGENYDEEEIVFDAMNHYDDQCHNHSSTGSSSDYDRYGIHYRNNNKAHNVTTSMPSPIPHHHQVTPKERKQIQRTNAETRMIFRLKIFVLLFLLISAVCVTYFFYAYLHHNEVDNYQKDVDQFADKIYRSVGISLELILSSMDSMTTSMVSYAKASSENAWPFITIPDFAVRIAKLRTISKAMHVSEALFVTHEQRLLWESYAKNNTSWM
jgi:hypothetical protein